LALPSSVSLSRRVGVPCPRVYRLEQRRCRHQELGTSTIPPRSFLAGAAHAKGEEAANTVGRNIVISGIMGRRRIP
jgi:hypothetical protein